MIKSFCTPSLLAKFFVIAVFALLTASCSQLTWSPSQVAKQAIETDVSAAHELELDIYCPDDKEIRGLDTFRCTALTNSEELIRIDVKANNDEGTVEIQPLNLIPAEKVTQVEKGLSIKTSLQTGVEIEVDCGEGHIIIDQTGRFECRNLDEHGRDRGAIWVTLDDPHYYTTSFVIDEFIASADPIQAAIEAIEGSVAQQLGTELTADCPPAKTKTFTCTALTPDGFSIEANVSTQDDATVSVTTPNYVRASALRELEARATEAIQKQITDISPPPSVKCPQDYAPLSAELELECKLVPKDAAIFLVFSDLADLSFNLRLDQ